MTLNCGLRRLAVVSLFLVSTAMADDKPTVLRSGAGSSPDTAVNDVFARPPKGQKTGRRLTLGDSSASFPVVVVRGTPYEMGKQIGELMRDEIRSFVPPTMAGLSRNLKLSNETIQEVWARTAAFGDDRIEQELAGLADGCGLKLSLLQMVHALPLLMPYSCSSIAAWGDATEDGHLYQTRNLDWNMEMRAHDFPCVVVYMPDHGLPHVVPTFAGIIGAHTGLNARGIVLAEMGDASAKEMPYQVHAPHFTIFFRTMLYDADSLTHALNIFKSQPLTKRYHFVFGDGQVEKRAVKIRAHSPLPPDRQVAIWKDNDPKDEFAPKVLGCVVYNDEGRGAFPTLQRERGKLNAEKMIKLANQIPIKGDNVVNVVYDATGLRLWISYAKGDQEAYTRPYVLLDMKSLLGSAIPVAN